MTDESSLIDLIRANDAAPLPRLIYADWLDDVGDPPSTQKATFLRLWCQLSDTPLSELNGYSELAAGLEALKPGLADTWLRAMDGHRFRIASADDARVRANAFLCNILYEGDFEISSGLWHAAGWVVSFSVTPTVDGGDLPGREKEHRRGGLRKAKRAIVPSRRVRLPAYPSATPLFVDRTTGRVDWYRNPRTQLTSQAGTGPSFPSEAAEVDRE
ncbi:TIGR02996 domain-containing protein [Frigoriglobus tundricola]|nr:TIGR02996 domain-containing protein [Frigoriglobus tundricola]